ncbi:hypothetical protein NDU88_005863 [Pleurodeles waltl]|uniref:Putative nuclease HARBI1 n=1 Tax=Pleurodeles waltl TaxID=8319 RepID=A0AAV7MFX7_PLEWA|nr:hypothetical protein NDU88_005863 [Pleurodeles waltl]
MAEIYLIAVRRRVYAAQQRRRRGHSQEKIYRTRQTLFQQTEEEIYDKYRLSSAAILELIDLLKPQLEHQTLRGCAIPTHVQVLCSLHLLASGSYQGVIAVAGGVSQSAVSRFLTAFLDALVTHMSHFIYLPRNEAEINSTKLDFYRIANFPHVIGCVYGTHIQICPPGNLEHLFRNRKCTHSLNIQVVCDAHYVITDIVAKFPGSTHDSYIFRHSGIHQRLERGEFGDGYLLGRATDTLQTYTQVTVHTNQDFLTVYFLCPTGDSAYALRPWIMTPFLTPSNECERRYNNAHKRTRNLIERTFGLLKARFRCLHRSGGALQYTPITAFKIVVACAILHNIATRRGLPLTPADPDPDDEEQEQPHRHHVDRSTANQGRLRREHIASQYFGRYVSTPTILTY